MLNSGSRVSSANRNATRKKRSAAVYDKALKEILETVLPVAPPDESVKAIISVAKKFSLSPNETTKIISDFLKHYNIKPNKSPPVAILRSGYQVTFGNEKKLLDNLTNAIIGESLTKCTKKKAKLPLNFFENVSNEIADEINHVQTSVYEGTARHFFGFLLLEHVLKKYKHLLSEAFPTLKTNPARVTELLNDSKKSMVLLLGKDTGRGYSRLSKIKKEIEKHNLTCVLIKNQPEHPAQPLISKVILYAMLAKLVVVENSYPSGHLYEIPFVRNAEAIIAILQEKGRGATRMCDDMIPKQKFINVFYYDEQKLATTVDEALMWAETVVQEYTEIHKKAWPWFGK